MNQRFLWVRIIESEKMDKIKLETDIWVYQKWDCLCYGVCGGGGVEYKV
jgi:hypothetical protein